MKRAAVVSTLVCSTVMGCASDPDEIGSTYVSPNQYASYDCNQLENELKRVGGRVAEVTGQQEEEATGDAVATGVGLVLFWPALFFLAGDDKEEELKRLKGQHQALEKAAIKKECTIAEKLKDKRQKEKEKETNADKGEADGRNAGGGRSSSRP